MRVWSRWGSHSHGCHNDVRTPDPYWNNSLPPCLALLGLSYTPRHSRIALHLILAVCLFYLNSSGSVRFQLSLSVYRGILADADTGSTVPLKES